MVCGPSEERSRVAAPPPVTTVIGVPARARRFAAACRRIAAGTAAVLLGVVLAQPVAAQSRTSLTASPQGAVPQGVGAQERRIAMVVGNARYRRLPLANPENDARLIASRLRDLGFDVREHLNLASRDFRRLLREFTRQVQETPGVVVFYYAGHGVQIDGRNYLLPIDVNLGNEDEIKDDSVDIDDLFVSRLESAKAQTRIVILDACRDNPFANRTRTIRAAGGLAEMAARGTLIAYASAPGATAEDGPGGSNSVYTRHLAEQMMVEGAEVEQMFKRVRVRVLQDTKDRQVPWVNTSLTTNFSFKPRIGPDPAEVARQAQLQRLEAELERTRQLLDQARLRVEQADAIALAASRTGSAPGGPSAAPRFRPASARPCRPVRSRLPPDPRRPIRCRSRSLHRCRRFLRPPRRRCPARRPRLRSQPLRRPRPRQGSIPRSPRRGIRPAPGAAPVGRGGSPGSPGLVAQRRRPRWIEAARSDRRSGRAARAGPLAGR